MAKQSVNLGAAPTGVGGDTFRSAASKLQANDNEVYAQLGADAEGNLPNALPVNKGGTGAQTTELARQNLGLGTASTRDVGTSSENLVPAKDVPSVCLAARNTVRTPAFSLNNASAGDISFFDADVGKPQMSPGFSYGVVYTYNTDPNGSIGKFQVAYSYISSEMAIRCKGVADWQQWAYVLTSLITTIDGNGFIKAASPIVKLYTSKIDLNDEAQKQSISYEKLSLGDYLIKGSTGFAQEGWYIETPKDANGNALVAVIYTQLENKDISVKTYKKKFDLETASIVADLNSPVDIPDGRWIDIRLQELPQPEFVPPVAHTPTDFQPTGIAKAVSEMMNGTEQ